MTNEEINTKLYKKLFAEQEEFKKQLLMQSPEEILRRAYEYNIREDILLELEYFDLSDERAAALLASSSPMDDLFNDFEKIETEHMETIRICIENYADGKIRNQKKQTLKGQFTVMVMETLKREITVDASKLNAPTEIDAEQMVSDLWHSGDIILDADDFKEVKFKAVE